jgi:chemotaxis protein MotC
MQMVRSLQLVQDRIAVGDHAALPMQKKLLEMIDARLRGGTAEELAEPANFRAVLVYAMSGGNPATLETVMAKLPLSEADSRKAIGVYSYLTGGSKAAMVSLRAVDPLTEPPELGAFLALVKGSVVSLEDPKRALKLLDQARLLSPGTLVEEGALRRSITLDATIGDTARFLLASEQYVRSFLRSPYASQFADSFVAGIVTLHETIDLEAVETIVSLMTPEQRQVIYLRIARRAAIDGLTALSHFATERTTVAEAPVDPSDDPRALLYSSLANVATEPVDALRTNLARIDRTRLSPGDLKLLDAVTVVSHAMTDPPKVAAGAKAPTEASDPGSAAPEGAEPATIDAPAPETAASEAPLPAADPAVAVGAPVEADGAAAPVVNAEAEASQDDPAQIVLAEGRKKLDEIDQLLAKAAK